MTDTNETKVKATTAIAEYEPTAAAIATLREQYATDVVVVDTPERLAGAKASYKDIHQWRTKLEDKRKEIKKPALLRCKEIDSEAKRIDAELQDIEAPYDHAIKEEKRKAKEAKEAEERAEAERIEKARATIDYIRGVPVTMMGATAETLAGVIADIELRELSGLDEFSGIAMKEQATTLATLRRMLDDVKAAEEREAKAAEERAEFERLKTEDTERRRVEAEKQAEENAERRAKLEKDERESQARIERQEREARELRAKEDAERRAEEDRLAKERAEREAKLRAEEDRLAKERAEAEAKARAEQRAKEDKEREEQRRVKDLNDGRAMLAQFVELHGSTPEFAVVTEAIRSYLAVEIAA